MDTKTKQLGINTMCQCPACGFAEETGGKPRTFCSQCRFPLLVIDGRFELKCELAVGGFGTVYLADDLKSQEQAVIKIIKPELVQSESLLIRFRREIRITELLAKQNNHIVRILSHGKEDGVGHYYAMEYLDGQSLGEYIDSTAERSLHEVFWIFRQFCEAMQEAHANGIVHRDLKPDNLFLVQRGDNEHYLKVLDFGIAKPLHGTANEGLTATAMGTPHYMAPEQCVNRAIDARTDIYSMGVILYELLTKTLPFDSAGDNPLSVVFAHLQKVPESPTLRKPELAISDELNAVVLKALEKDPEERFQTAKEFWGALALCPDLPNAPTIAEGLPAYTSKLKAGLAPTGILVHEGISALQADARNTLESSSGQKLVTVENLGVGNIQKVAGSEADEGTKKGRLVTPVPLPFSKKGPADPSHFDEELSTVVSATPFVVQGPPERSKTKVIAIAIAVLVMLSIAAAGIYWQGSQSTPRPGAVAHQNRSLPKGPARAMPRSALPTARPRVVPRQSVIVLPLRLMVPAPHQRQRARGPKAAKRVRLARLPRKIHKRGTRAHRRRKVLRRTGPCGEMKGAFSAIFGKMQAPQGTMARIKTLGCKGCRVQQRAGGYCLFLPSALARARVRIYARGYQTCTHWISTKTRTLLWTLKEENPDGLGGTSYYPCAKAKP